LVHNFYMNLFSIAMTRTHLIYIELRDVLLKNFEYTAYTNIQVLNSSNIFRRPAAIIRQLPPIHITNSHVPCREVVGCQCT